MNRIICHATFSLLLVDFFGMAADIPEPSLVMDGAVGNAAVGNVRLTTVTLTERGKGSTHSLVL